MAFDVITPEKLAAGAIGTSVSTFRTTPDLARDIVKTIDIANTTAATITVTVYFVPDGDSAGDASAIIPSTNIPANSIFQWTGAQVLNAGDTIQAVASATGSTIHVSGGVAV